MFCWLRSRKLYVMDLQDFVRSKKFFIPVIGLTFLVFVLGASLWLDPDFGWHNRLGQIILSSGIPRADPFSFTMPSYPFVDYEWLTNVLYFLAPYNWLALFHALLALSAPLIAVFGLKKKTQYWLVPVLLVWASFFVRFGVRPQIFNWFFLSILIRIFYDRTNWNRLRWFFPPLMLIWVNFHGSYPLGIGLGALLILLKFLEDKHVNLTDCLILLLSIGATFVNPYGVYNWKEVVAQMQLSGLYRKTVAEWQTAFFTFEMGYFALYSFTSVLMLANRKKLRLWELVILIGGFLAGVSSGRYVPLSSLLVAPFLAKYFHYTAQKAKGLADGARRLNIFYALLVGVSLIILLISIVASARTWSLFRENNFYPKEAASFLINDNNTHNVFADYGLGGYLIWKLPNSKFFIDGRMAGFVWDKAPEGESNNIYREYLAVMCGETSLSSILERYPADMIIVPAGSKEAAGIESITESRLKDLFHKFGLLYCKDNISLTKEVQNLDWDEVYNDNKWIIYQR